jgi:hypothetical protein
MIFDIQLRLMPATMTASESSLMADTGKAAATIGLSEAMPNRKSLNTMPRDSRACLR